MHHTHHTPQQQLPLSCLSSSSSRCLRCNAHFSTSDDPNSRPLPCLACNRPLERDTKYFRLKDPAGGNTKRGTDVVRCLHRDGSSCRPVSAHTASVHPCCNCKKTSDEVGLVDSSGDDSPAFITCVSCFYKDRAALIVDVRALLVTGKAKSQAEDVTSPKKPNT